MKKFILPLLIVSQFAWADCDIKSASRLVTEHTVGDIINLVKSKSMGQCTVAFDIAVNGKTYHLTETEKGLEQEESLCYYARERARQNLLLNLGGKFKSEAVTVCKDGDLSPQKVRTGDIILENEVGVIKEIPQYFRYNNAKCRMFEVRFTENRIARNEHGVICQADNSKTNWLVVDKW